MNKNIILGLALLVVFILFSSTVYALDLIFGYTKVDGDNTPGITVNLYKYYDNQWVFVESTVSTGQPNVGYYGFGWPTGPWVNKVKMEATYNGETITKEHNFDDPLPVNLYFSGSSPPPPPPNQPPVADFSYSFPDPNQHTKIKFDASSSNDPDGHITSYSWDFDDGETGNGEIVEHVFGISGHDYYVTLTLTDDDGATGSITKTVTTGCIQSYSFESPESGDKIIFNITNPKIEIKAWGYDCNPVDTLHVDLEIKTLYIDPVTMKRLILYEKVELPRTGHDQFGNVVYEGVYDASQYVDNDVLIKGEKIYGEYSATLEESSAAISFTVNSDFNKDGQPDLWILTKAVAAVHHAVYENVIGKCAISLSPYASFGSSATKIGVSVYNKDTDGIKRGWGKLAIKIIGDQIVEGKGIKHYPIINCIMGALEAVNKKLGIDIEPITIMGFSPIDIELYDSNGNPKENIFYLGPDSHPEILIFFPEESESYQIITQGTGSGTFTFVIRYAQDMTYEAIYSDINVDTSTKTYLDVKNKEINYTMRIDYNSDGLIDEYRDPDEFYKRNVTSEVEPPKINITSPEEKEYSYTEGLLDIVYTIGGDLSNIIEVIIKLDDIIINGLQIALDALSIGIHQLTITVTDIFGNEGSTTQRFTVIDDVPPEIIIVSPEERVYFSNELITIEFIVTDEKSNVSWVKAMLDGNEVNNGDTIDIGYLEFGNHTFVVSAADEWDNEASANVTFEVKPAVTFRITPRALNLKSKGNWVTVRVNIESYIYDASNIDVSSLLLQGIIPPEPKPSNIGENGLMVKFDRASLESLLSPGEAVEITLTGEVAGYVFEASDAIKVILKEDKVKKKQKDKGKPESPPGQEKKEDKGDKGQGQGKGQGKGGGQGKGKGKK